MLRAFAPEDYDAVVALWRRCEGIGLGESDTRAATAAFLARNPDMSSVALAGGSIVGAVLCGTDGRRGYLHHLAVDPSHRRRGVAAALLRRSFEQLAAREIQKCNIFLFADNAEGDAFWRHDGWTWRADLRVLQKRVR